MTTINRKQLTKAQALARTRKHRSDLVGLKKGWLQLGRAVAKSILLGVPAAMGMTMRAWIDDTFEQSASHIFRQLQNFQALKGVSESQLEKMPEGNAHQLTRLSEKERKSPAMIQKAITLKPSEFKEVVDEVRNKNGHKPEEWATYARRIPKSVYDEMLAAEDKVARILQLDIAEESAKRMTNLILIVEAIAALINTTDELHLKVEIEGDPANARSAPQSGVGASA